MKPEWRKLITALVSSSMLGCAGGNLTTREKSDSIVANVGTQKSARRSATL